MTYQIFILFNILLTFSCNAYEDILEYETMSPQFELDYDCIKKTLASDDDIEAIQNYHTPVTKNGKCLLACMYKKLNILTPDGRYNPEGSLTIAAKRVSLQHKEMIRITKLIQFCNQEVSTLMDDEAGCEIAVTFFSCVLENHSKFDSDEDDEP